MPYQAIPDEVLDFGRPLSAITMRILRDNVTRVQVDNTARTITMQRLPNGAALGLSYYRMTVHNIAPAEGTILAVRFVGTPTAVGGNIISLRANPNSSGGVNFNAVCDSETASTVSASYVLITGSLGGLST